MNEDELMRLAAHAELAGAVTSELAGPLARVAETLGELVDRLDRHVAVARGPEPLSWNAVGELRQRLADLFYDAGRIKRLAADLALVSGHGRDRERADPNELVERALSLARHKFSDEQDVLLDLGSLPMVEVNATRLVQALAHLFLAVAASAGPVAVRTFLADDAHVGVSLRHPGPPLPSPFGSFIAAEIAEEGGGLAYSEEAGSTTTSLTLRVAK